MDLQHAATLGNVLRLNLLTFSRFQSLARSFAAAWRKLDAALGIGAADLRAGVPGLVALPAAHHGLVRAAPEAADGAAANVRRPALFTFEEPAPLQHHLARRAPHLYEPGQAGLPRNAHRRWSAFQKVKTDSEPKRNPTSELYCFLTR